jgi:hypothetical protein
MIFLQKWRKLGITWYVLALLITRWPAYCSRANALFSGFREEGRLSPMVLLLSTTLDTERRLRMQNRLCHSWQGQDLCTLAPFRSIRVPETDRVESHRTPGYLYDKPKLFEVGCEG